MIVKEKLSWIRLLLRVRGSSFSETWPRIFSATAVAVVVSYIELHYGFQKYSLTTTPFMLIGVALGIFLGFRNNAAYDRFWEGRKLWGSLVNTSRSLARQAFSLLDTSEGSPDVTAFRQTFVRRNIAFVHALRHHLRDDDPLGEIQKFLPPADLEEVAKSRHRPLAILQQLGRDMAEARSRQWLSEVSVLAIDGQLVELSNILGACERIKNTPIPFTYTVLIHRLVAFYCLFLPFGIVDSAGMLTPVVTFLISHAFFGLDAIGDEIEEPFGTLPNNLPLATISRNIEINLLELLGETDLPEPLKPSGRLLL
jgi:ion channel-forming bestrophin family protein